MTEIDKIWESYGQTDCHTAYNKQTDWRLSTHRYHRAAGVRVDHRRCRLVSLFCLSLVNSDDQFAAGDVSLATQSQPALQCYMSTHRPATERARLQPAWCVDLTKLDPHSADSHRNEQLYQTPSSIARKWSNFIQRGDVPALTCSGYSKNYPKCGNPDQTTDT